MVEFRAWYETFSRFPSFSCVHSTWECILFSLFSKTFVIWFLRSRILIVSLGLDMKTKSWTIILRLRLSLLKSAIGSLFLFFRIGTNKINILYLGSTEQFFILHAVFLVWLILTCVRLRLSYTLNLFISFFIYSLLEIHFHSLQYCYDTTVAFSSKWQL